MLPGRNGVLSVFLISLVALAAIPTAAVAAWSSPVSVSPPDQNLRGSPIETALGPDGSIYATWETVVPGGDGAMRSMQLARITSSGNVGTPVSITGSLPNSAWRDIAVGADGSIVVAWTSSYDGRGVSVQAVRIAPSGNVGPVRTLYNGATAAFGTKVVVGANGQATVLWARESDTSPYDPRIVQASRMLSDGRTTMPQTLGSGGNPYVSAAIQPSGRVLVSWSGSRFTSLSPGGVQGPTTDLDPGQATDSVAALALAATGEGIISWRRSSGEIATRRVRADGTLGPVVRLSPLAHDARSGPDVGVSSNGLATTAWSDDQDVWIAQTTGDGPASAAVRLNVPGGSSNAEHAIAVDAAGTSTITWIDRTGGNDSSTWRVRAAVVSSSGVPQPSALVSGPDEPRGTTRTLAGSTGTATALWQTFPGGTHPVVRMARSDGAPTGSQPPPFPLSATPTYASVAVGQTHTITGQLLDATTRAPVPGAPLRAVIQPPAGSSTAPTLLSCSPSPCNSDTNGDVSFTYKSSVVRTDTVVVFRDANANKAADVGEEQVRVEVDWVGSALPSCPATKLIGVRGSDPDPAPLGKPVGALASELTKRHAVDSSNVKAISYPATIYPRWGTLRGYTESVAAGRRALVTALTKDPCKAKSRYILAGYSQGAHVIGDVLSSNLPRTIRQQIAIVILFGDPKFNPDDRRFKPRGDYQNSYGGLLGPREKGSITGPKNDYPIRTYCRDRDPFCQGRQKVFGGFGLPVGNAFVDPIYDAKAHMKYVDPKYIKDAADAVKRAL